MSFSTISTSPLPDKIKVPTSKSYANRALILAALSTKACRINNVSWSQDVLDMIDVLKKIGLKISTNSDHIIVHNSFPECEKSDSHELELCLGEGGTTSRFLVGMLSLGKRKYHLRAKLRMNKRPMRELYKTLREIGVTIKSQGQDSFPIYLQGPIQDNSKIDIDCSETTQFYSSLLLLTKFKKLDISPLNLHGSKGYVDITKKLLKTFSSDYLVPVDFSGASYPIAYAALNRKITISNCFERDLLQGDSVILEVIKNSGAQYSFDKMGLHITPSDNFKSFELDCIDCPDLVPTLCYLAAHAQGVSKLYNIANLRQKESDRIEGVINLMQEFSVDCGYDSIKDELVIKGRKTDTKNRKISVEHDHRMVMSAALFLKHNGGGELSSKEAVTKSFPDFFEIF